MARSPVRPPDARSGARRGGRERWVGVAASVVAHGAAIVGLLLVHPLGPAPFEPVPMTVALVAEPHPPAPAPEPKTPPKPPKPQKRKPKPVHATARPVPVKAVPRRQLARVVHNPRPYAAPLAAGQADSNGEADVSDAELAGAASAGSGPPGGECDMARRLQDALRRDPLVRSAVSQVRTAEGRARAIRVWNGDWVKSNGEDGKGLAAVREAIMWEVAFAPKACRAEPVRGLILISMNEGPGGARLVVGSGYWRWSDLLLLRSGR